MVLRAQQFPLADLSTAGSPSTAEQTFIRARNARELQSQPNRSVPDQGNPTSLMDRLLTCLSAALTLTLRFRHRALEWPQMPPMHRL